MVQLNIKPEDRPLILEGRYTQPHPRVMQKYDALRLKDFGLSNKLICTILGICNNTLLSFFKQYSEGGLERLNAINFNRPESDLTAYSTVIEQYFKDNPPRSISEAAAKIEAITGIKRGETQVRKFLRDRGFRFRRVGTVPAKALTEEKKRTEKLFGAGVRATSGRSQSRQKSCLFC
jgi:transposase